jgi:hypothetical protein
MKFKFLNAAILGLVLTVSSVANAGLIAIDDWHLTSDSLGGLRQSTFDSSVYFAITQQQGYLSTDTFSMISGFHWASTAEAFAIFGSTRNGDFSNTRVYYNQGGWNGYIDNDGNSNSYQFIYNDTFSTGKYKHAGNYEEHLSNTHGNISARVAGLVLIKDPVTDVPEPSTLAIFALGMIGLASRRFKKQS